MLRRLLVVLILAVTSLAFATSRPAWACSCGVSDDYLSHAESAFVGVAADVDKPFFETGDVTVRFDVEQVQKGDIGDDVELTTSNPGPACGYEFTEGHRYQIYSNGGETNSCDGNVDLGFVSAPGSDVPTALWITIGGVVVIAAGLGFFLYRGRRQ